MMTYEVFRSWVLRSSFQRWLNPYINWLRIGMVNVWKRGSILERQRAQIFTELVPKALCKCLRLFLKTKTIDKTAKSVTGK
jgi:hypothetical protein